MSLKHVKNNSTPLLWVWLYQECAWKRLKIYCTVRKKNPFSKILTQKHFSWLFLLWILFVRESFAYIAPLSCAHTVLQRKWGMLMAVFIYLMAVFYSKDLNEFYTANKYINNLHFLKSGSNLRCVFNHSFSGFKLLPYPGGLRKLSLDSCTNGAAHLNFYTYCL